MRPAIIVFLALLMLSCHSDPTVGPTPILPSPSPAPVPGLVAYRVSGLVVDERGAGVPGADVTFHGSGRSFTTDATGAYDVTIELRQRGTDVTVQKHGYEPSRHWLALDESQAVSRNLRLHDVQRIAAGHSLRVVLNLDDPGCAYELYTCRRVRIRSSSRGTLTIDVTPDQPATQFGMIIAGQEPGLSPTVRLSVPVVADADTAIEILLFSGRFPEGLTLSTSLEPR